MLWTLILMFVSIVMSGVVVVYVAYPHRGEKIPGAPWLGTAMKRGVESLPTIANERSRS